jgi:hypothetical protein
MRYVIVLLATLGLFVPCSRAQDDLSPNSSLSKPMIRDIACPNPANQAACSSFVELTKANDADINSLVSPSHSPDALSFVCFDDFTGSFFTVRYANAVSFPRVWMMSVKSYTNGLSDSSWGLTVLARHRLTANESTDSPPPNPLELFSPRTTSIYVSDSELEVTSTFSNVGKGQTVKQLSIQLHTGRFRIAGTYENPAKGAGKPSETGVLPDETGRCVNLWKYAKSPGDERPTSTKTFTVWSPEETYAWETYQALGPDDRDYVRSLCAANPVGVAMVPRAREGGPSPDHAISCSSWLAAKEKAPQ